MGRVGEVSWEVLLWRVGGECWEAGEVSWRGVGGRDKLVGCWGGWGR